MKNNTMRNIVGSSILAVALFGAGVGMITTKNAVNGSAVMGTTNVSRALPSKGLKVAAFANLESFDNDGFNNSVKLAAEEYMEYVGQDKATSDFVTSFYSDTGEEYVSMFEDLYAKNDNDLIISAGFQVANAFNGMPDFVTGDRAFDGVFTKADGTETDLANHDEKGVVLLDDTALAAEYTNAASVSFAAEGAGFLSAIGAAVYTEYDVAVNNKNNGNIVMWGGMAFPTVFDYMSGFAQGINWANETYDGETLTLSDGSTFEYKYISLWNGGTTKGESLSETNSYYGTTADNADDWYTFGFDAATGTTSGDAAKLKTENAINAGASVVFPIAGGNTAVAEQALSNAPKSSTTKMLGVDVDSTMSATNPDLYIGSATKNLKDGGAAALWGMDNTDTTTGTRNYEEGIIAGNKYSEAIDAWGGYDDTTLPGLQLRGTVENEGVGFTYTGQSGNADENMTSAIALFEGLDLEVLTETAIAAAGTIESSDSHFGGDNDVTGIAPEGEIIPNELASGDLTWLWITLGVVLGLGVIGLIVWLVLRKKEEA